VSVSKKLLPLTPIPPATTNAPEVGFVDVVASCNIKLPASNVDQEPVVNNLVTSVGKQKDEFDIYETCVMCGEETTTLKTTHVDFRYGYVEGAGQLCRECYLGEDRNLITVNSRTILDTPNDAELGAKVRELYWESKK
jgi:hypothetical protein